MGCYGMRTFLVFTFCLCLFFPLSHAMSPEETAARELLQRLLPDHVESFVFETIPQEKGKDVFEVMSRDGRIVLRGNTGVAMASALNHYLNHFCNASVSLQGHQLRLPTPLPVVDQKIRVVTPFQYR